MEETKVNMPLLGDDFPELEVQTTYGLNLEAKVADRLQFHDSPTVRQSLVLPVFPQC